MSNERTIDPATILLAIKTTQAVATTLLGVIEAIETIKNGDPDKVDLEELKKQLLNLPDLPVDD